MGSKKMWHSSDTEYSTKMAWIPLVLLVTIPLTATIFPNWKPVINQVEESMRIASFRNSDRARFAVSPWLKAPFKTADAIRPHLERGVPLVVGGQHRFFVAYRLRPKVCFQEKPRIEDRLREEGLTFAKIDQEKKRTVRFLNGPVLFVDGFEKGHASLWFANCERRSDEPR